MAPRLPRRELSKDCSDDTPKAVNIEVKNMPITINRTGVRPMSNGGILARIEYGIGNPLSKSKTFRVGPRLKRKKTAADAAVTKTSLVRNLISARIENTINGNPMKT